MSELSTLSEIAVAYALHTVGTSEHETQSMRAAMVIALRELGHHDAAAEVQASIRDHSVKV